MNFQFREEFAVCFGCYSMPGEDNDVECWKTFLMMTETFPH